MTAVIENTQKVGANVAIPIFALWLVVVLGLFWLLQFRYEAVWVSFEGSTLPQLDVATGKLQVLHFVDESCPCTKFSRDHVKDMEAKWASDTVQFATLDVAHAGALNERFKDLVPASPAVAVWDEQGQVAFFGPYTSGAICGEGEDLLSKMLANPRTGQWVNQESVGCFCRWPEGQTS